MSECLCYSFMSLFKVISFIWKFLLSINMIFYKPMYTNNYNLALTFDLGKSFDRHNIWLFLSLPEWCPTVFERREFDAAFMATYLVLWLNTSKLHFYGERMRRSSQLNNHTVESLQIVLGAGYQGEYRVGIGRISFFF